VDNYSTSSWHTPQSFWISRYFTVRTMETFSCGDVFQKVTKHVACLQKTVAMKTGQKTAPYTNLLMSSYGEFWQSWDASLSLVDKQNFWDWFARFLVKIHVLSTWDNWMTNVYIWLWKFLSKFLLRINGDSSAIVWTTCASLLLRVFKGLHFPCNLYQCHSFEN